jgi:PAS domain S-box-containing protein
MPPPTPSPHSQEEEISSLRAQLVETQRALEEARRQQTESTAEIEELMDLLPIPVMITHDGGCVRMTGNRAALEFLRLKKEDNLSQSAPEGERPGFTLWSHDRRLSPEELPAQRAAAGEPVSGMEMELRFSESDRFHVLCHSNPIRNKHGELKGSITAFVDISAQKRAESALMASEERFRKMFHHAPIPVAISLPDGHYVEVNQAYADMLGYSREEILQRTFIELTHPEDRQATTTDVVADMQSGKIQRFRAEKRFLHRSGRIVWGETSVSVIRNMDESVAYFITQTQDISLRKEAEEKLREAAERKDQFLAILSHELRNPLAAIRHALQLGKESPQDTTLQPWAREVVDRQTLQLSRMVSDLLDNKRLDLGLVELRREPLELASVLRSAAAAVAAICNEKQHQLRVDAAPALIAEGDAARLEQVFSNLLHNAAKFTPARGEVRLVARREGTEAVLTVTDNGPGIPADMLACVFEPFRQADRSLDHSLGGLGLGLAVVRSLVESHGGSVAAANNTPASGATFTVRLPLLPETAPVPEQVPATGPRKLSRRVRVLVVDDHADNAQGMARILSLRNCEVRLAHDGLAGLEAAKDFLPEVLLLDIGLPGLDGYALAAALRSEPALANALFIAVSGYAQAKDQERARAAGFDFHYGKPIEINDLMAFIGTRLDC